MRRVTITRSGCALSSCASDLAEPSAYGRSVLASPFSGRRESSAISRPANLTLSASRRSRLPPHSLHSVLSMYAATRRFISALWVVAKV